MSLKYVGLILEIFATHSDKIGYILMVGSMIESAGLISIGFPLLVFGYALMEEV